MNSGPFGLVQGTERSGGYGEISSCRIWIGIAICPKERRGKCYLPRPLLYPTIVFTAWSQCSYHVSGIPFGWFWLRTLCKYWVTIQLFNNFSEVDALFRHAESSGCTGWCFLITVAMVPASILTLTITACLLFWLQRSTNWPQNNLSPCNLEGLDRTSITEHC